MLVALRQEELTWLFSFDESSRIYFTSVKFLIVLLVIRRARNLIGLQMKMLFGCQSTRNFVFTNTKRTKKERKRFLECLVFVITKEVSTETSHGVGR